MFSLAIGIGTAATSLAMTPKNTIPFVIHV